MIRRRMVAAAGVLALATMSLLAFSSAAQASNPVASAASVPGASVSGVAVPQGAGGVYKYYATYWGQSACQLVGAGGSLHGNWYSWYCSAVATTPTTWQLWVDYQTI